MYSRCPTIYFAGYHIVVANMLFCHQINYIFMPHPSLYVQDFLSDPGKPGVRSMGPDVSEWVQHLVTTASICKPPTFFCGKLGTGKCVAQFA